MFKRGKGQVRIHNSIAWCCALLLAAVVFQRATTSEARTEGETQHQLHISEVKAFFIQPPGSQYQHVDVVKLEPQTSNPQRYSNRIPITGFGDCERSFVLTIGVASPSLRNSHNLAPEEQFVGHTVSRLTPMSSSDLLHFKSNQPYYYANRTFGGLRSIFYSGPESCGAFVDSCQCSFQARFMAELPASQYRTKDVDIQINFDYLAVKPISVYKVRSEDLWRLTEFGDDAQRGDCILTCSACACPKDHVRLEFSWSFRDDDGDTSGWFLSSNMKSSPNKFLLKGNNCHGRMRATCHVAAYDLTSGQRVAETTRSATLGGFRRRGPVRVKRYMEGLGCLYASGCQENNTICHPSTCYYSVERCEDPCMNPYCAIIHCGW